MSVFWGHGRVQNCFRFSEYRLGTFVFRVLLYFCSIILCGVGEGCGGGLQQFLSLKPTTVLIVGVVVVVGL